ncbi:MAG: hypothetical protein JWP15_1263 [Alphaproteobacteria bacterium]|nr:hypothetical protein [Alphaproteobacteria bacterium]
MPTDQIAKTAKVELDFGKGSREQSQSGPRRKQPERFIAAVGFTGGERK